MHSARLSHTPPVTTLSRERPGGPLVFEGRFCGLFGTW